MQQAGGAGDTLRENPELIRFDRLDVDRKKICLHPIVATQSEGIANRWHVLSLGLYDQECG